MITKGTMTGVLARLEEKQLIQRIPSGLDGRAIDIRLTQSGEALFEPIYAEHIEYLQQVFRDLPQEQIDNLENNLMVLLDTFKSGLHLKLDV